MQTWKCQNCGYKYDGDYNETCPSCKNSCSFIDATNYVPESFGSEGKKMTKIYCDPFCPSCSEIAGFLKKNGVKFEFVSVDDSEQAKKQVVELSGQDKLPVVVIGDDVFKPPFDDDKLQSIVAKS